MLLSCSGGTQGHAQAAMIHITEDASLSLECPSGREQPHTLAHIGPRGHRCMNTVARGAVFLFVFGCFPDPLALPERQQHEKGTEDAVEVRGGLLRLMVE